MRILKLAKELGVSHNRLLAWAASAGLPYSHPDDLVEQNDEVRIRKAFSRSRPAPSGAQDRPAPDDQSFDTASVDAILDSLVDSSFSPEDFDLPDTLEELEAIEREVMRSPPEQQEVRPRPERISTRDILARYGISGKSILKKLRKLLPDDIARLLNQQDLTGEQVTRLTEGIETRAALHCDHGYCSRTAQKAHSPEIVIPVRDATFCTVCQGSPTRRAIAEASEVCRESGVRRILVVGGMPASHTEMKKHAPASIEFRLVEGDLDRPRQRVVADLRWCDLAVIWGSTPLGHSLSGSYLRKKSSSGPFILRINRRSVEALCQEIVKHLARRKRP